MRASTLLAQRPPGRPGADAARSEHEDRTPLRPRTPTIERDGTDFSHGTPSVVIIACGPGACHGTFALRPAGLIDSP
ncbi:MAG: hypothetical protein U1F58_04800 [Burkholderiales bacterium]